MKRINVYLCTRFYSDEMIEEEKGKRYISGNGRRERIRGGCREKISRFILDRRV
jgi:hypothetical protein